MFFSKVYPFELRVINHHIIEQQIEISNLIFLCSKKRTVGVVEPRVVVKIPLAKVRGSSSTCFDSSSNSIIRHEPQPTAFVAAEEGHQEHLVPQASRNLHKKIQSVTSRMLRCAILQIKLINRHLHLCVNSQFLGSSTVPELRSRYHTS